MRAFHFSSIVIFQWLTYLAINFHFHASNTLPTLLVRATNERRVLALVATNGFHWLK